MPASETAQKTNECDTKRHDFNTASGNEKSITDLNTLEDPLISLETLRESPIEWPERLPGMDDFLTMSETPIHTPNVENTCNMTADDILKMNQLAAMTSEQLITKIKSMHDEIYQLGLREAKEMTRGKLLGIFDRVLKRKP